LIAAYSPPIPAPVKKRATKKYSADPANAVGDRRDQVHDQRREEQPLAAEPVCELAEEQRAHARARDVDRPRCQHLAVAEREPAVLLGQPRSDRADDRDLEAVEDPDSPEADHDHPVEPRPRQTVQPRRDTGLDRPQLSAAHAAAIPASAN
jgi:hypothetical protein